MSKNLLRADFTKFSTASVGYIEVKLLCSRLDERLKVAEQMITEIKSQASTADTAILQNNGLDSSTTLGK